MDYWKIVKRINKKNELIYVHLYLVLKGAFLLLLLIDKENVYRTAGASGDMCETKLNT